jgi:hypothetical protein
MHDPFQPGCAALPPAVNELLNARQSQKNPQAVISFVTAEWMRRFSWMAQDLSSDFERYGAMWPAQAVKDLERRVLKHSIGRPLNRR